MAFAVPLVKKDYKLYALGNGTARGGVAGARGVSRSRNSLSRSSLTGLMAARKRSVSDPSLSLNQAGVAANVASTSQTALAKRRSSHGATQLAFALRFKRKSESKAGAEEHKAKEEDVKDRPHSPTDDSPSHPPLQRSGSQEEPNTQQRYCGGRRGSGGSIIERRCSQEQSLYSMLSAITEDDEETETEMEVPIRMLSDSEATLEDPSLYESEPFEAKALEEDGPPAQRKASIIPPVADADPSAPILIVKSEVDKIDRMSPETKRKWRKTLLSVVRNRLIQIERIISTATPAN